MALVASPHFPLLVLGLFLVHSAISVSGAKEREVPNGNVEEVIAEEEESDSKKEGKTEPVLQSHSRSEQKGRGGEEKSSPEHQSPPGDESKSQSQEGEGVTVEDVQEGEEVKGEVGEPKKEEEEEPHEAPSGVRDPRPCEVCKYLAVELQGRLVETGRVKEYIETGHGIMPGDRKRKHYRKSELRFIEAVNEPHVCNKILDYDIHAERRKSLRYAKGHSETRKTLKWLRMKGVKVDMGMPEEMWTRDSPPNEIIHLQRLCIEMVEKYEDELEDWYWGHQEVHLLDYLCRARVLQQEDQGCLVEEHVEKKDEEETEEKEEDSEEAEESESKGDPGPGSSEVPPGGSPSPASVIHSTPPPGSRQMPHTQPPGPPTRSAQPMQASKTANKQEL